MSLLHVRARKESVRRKRALDLYCGCTVHFTLNSVHTRIIASTTVDV